jgi:hypothetical protein
MLLPEVARHLCAVDAQVYRLAVPPAAAGHALRLQANACRGRAIRSYAIVATGQAL